MILAEMIPKKNIPCNFKLHQAQERCSPCPSAMKANDMSQSHHRYTIISNHK